MNSSSYMAISSLFYIILLLITFFSKKRVSYIENKIYIGLMVSIFVSLIIFLISSIFSTVLINYQLCNEIILKLYTVSLEVWITILTIYTYSSSRKESVQKLEKVKKFINVFTIIAILLAVLIFILPVEYLVNKQNQYYIGGPCVNLVYVYSFIVIIMNIYMLIKNIKIIGIKKFMPLITFIILGIITIYITLLIPGLLLITPLEAFITFMMYFTIENPDLKILRELEFQKEQVENSKNISNKVINTISDSLNESINRISSFGHKKINYDNIEEVKKEVTSMQKFALKYIDNLDSLMELSKTQSEGFEIVNTKYEPLQVLDEIEDVLHVKNKNIIININKNSDIPPVVYGDSIKIKQILLHLYNGILRISKQKNINLNASYLVVGSLCRFKVSTEINANDLIIEYTKDLNENIIDFEVVDRIVKMIDGKFNITLKDDIVKIEISINQKYIDGYYVVEDKPIINKKINYIDLKNKNVLIIDDDKNRTDKLMHMLSNYNIKISVSTDYDSTMKEISEKVFDLIIIDDIISDFDEIKKYLLIDKTNGLLKIMDHIPYDVPRIIMVTPNIESYENKYIEEGFDGILTKPININKLDSIIDNFIVDKQNI